ncbi:MAG: hypothetical protein ABIQ36_09210, partial [Rhodanobacter sp.]
MSTVRAPVTSSASSANPNMNPATSRDAIVEIPLQPASYDIWDKKYRLKNKAGEPVDGSIDETY